MWSRFSNPAKFEELARICGPVAFWIFAVCAAYGFVAGLFYAPAEQYQGDSARIMYVHVPAAWMAMASYSFIALMSLIAFVIMPPAVVAVSEKGSASGAARTSSS